MSKLNQNGFSLIEIILVIALMSILSATAYFYMGDRGEVARLKSAARDLTSYITLARTSAIRDTSPWVVRFDSAGRNYALLSAPGEEPASWSDGNETIFRTVTLPGKVSFGSNQTPGAAMPAVGNGISHGNDLIIFNANGTCSEAGTVYLSVPSADFAVSNLMATGQAKIRRHNGTDWTD